MYSTLRTFDDTAEVVVDGIKTGWVITRHGALFTVHGSRATDTRLKCGYMYNEINGYECARHRLVAMAFTINPRPDMFDIVDHMDRNKLNNDWSNLRWVSHSLNMLNTVSKKKLKARPDKSKRPYRARMCIMNKRISLGYYATQEEAKRVMDYTRKSFFEALYFYHTRPNPFNPPEKWRMSNGRVFVS